MKELFLGLLLLQSIAMAIDEFYFHHKRGLGLWESLGHPLDTLTVIAAFAVIFFFPASEAFKVLFVGLSIFSCVFVTKDEFVHAKLCSWKENWVHAFLFMVHPALFVTAFFIWTNGGGSNFIFGMSFKGFILVHLLLLTSFMMYQLIFWNRKRFYGLVKN